MDNTSKVFVDDVNKCIYNGKEYSNIVDNKCPAGLFRDDATKKCLQCSSKCGVKGCTESDNEFKCKDCADSTQYLLIKSNATVGPCIVESLCKPPSLKDTSAKICYNSTSCPNNLYLDPVGYRCYRMLRAVLDLRLLSFSPADR